MTQTPLCLFGAHTACHGRGCQCSCHKADEPVVLGGDGAPAPAPLSLEDLDKPQPPPAYTDAAVARSFTVLAAADELDQLALELEPPTPLQPEDVQYRLARIAAELRKRFGGKGGGR